MTSRMVVCKSCGNWNPNYAVFCSPCGTRSKAKSIKRKPPCRLLVTCGVLLQLLISSEAYENENRNVQFNVQANSNDLDKLSLALNLLKKVLKDGTNHNRRYCAYCKVPMTTPIESHKQGCVWRQAWQLVAEKNPQFIKGSFIDRPIAEPISENTSKK